VAAQAYDKAQQLFVSSASDTQRYGNSATHRSFSRADCVGCRHVTMLNRMSYYPADTGRALLKSGQRITVEFPDLHYNRATVLKYLEEYCTAP
jgi:hypothetical protein